MLLTVTENQDIIRASVNIDEWHTDACIQRSEILFGMVSEKQVVKRL